MAVLTTGNTFASGDQVTASSLNNSVSNATFASGAVDNTSTQLSSGAIIVKDLGISSGKIAIDAVGTDQLANDVVINTSGSITGAAGSFTTLTASGDISVDGSVKQSGNTANLILKGGDTDGANIELYGALHTSYANEAFYDASTHSFRPEDGSSNRIVISSSGLTASGDLTVDTNTLKVDSTNNRVGIGTASPSEELEVSATGVGLLVRNSDPNQQAGIATVRGQRSDTNTSPASAGGISLESWNTSGATVVNEHLGSIYFGANHTSGSESNILGTASIAGIAEGTFSNSSTMPSAIAFRTGSAGQAIGVYNYQVGEVERMRIGSDGNVGIGTTDPVEKLQVVGNVRIGDGAGVLDDLVLKGSDAIGPSSVGGSTSAAIITTNGTPTGAGHIGIEVPSNDNGDGFYVATDPNQTGTADLLALKIDALGNVGIGETAPSAPLTVTSTTGGVILPRMTTTQMNAISSPANGEMIYNTTANKFYGYANGAWVALH